MSVWIEKRTNINGDDLIVKHFSPREGVPRYMDWMRALAARGAAHEVDWTDRITGKAIIDPETGKTKKTLIPKDQQIIIDDNGYAGIICIGCSQPTFDLVFTGQKRFSEAKIRRFGKLQSAHLKSISVELDRVRIGGYIQVRDEQVLSSTEIEIKWKRQPVFRMGLACLDCRREFDRLRAEANIENKQRELLGKLLAAAKEQQRLDGIESRLASSKSRIERMAQAGLNAEKAIQASTRCLHGLPDGRFCAACLRGRPIVKAVAAPGIILDIKLPGEVIPYLDVFSGEL